MSFPVTRGDCRSPDLYVDPVGCPTEVREYVVPGPGFEARLAALLRVPPPPYVRPWSLADVMHLGIGRPLFWKRPTLKVKLSPVFTLVLSPDESGGGLAFKVRF